MNNQTIITTESFKLMKEGTLKGSGVFQTIEDMDGVVMEVELPMEIHTFNGWKKRGYRVKKGEKSKIKFPIWKHAIIKSESEDGKTEIETEKMFMKLAAFFTIEQVEKIA
ncbi:MAG: hypothetical protein IKU15_09245 [Clostridia bacterium]|nr:hypothetical protein [Clostridia bacterium]